MSLTPTEGVPTTGLFQSFNGDIGIGGFKIIRVERATFEVSHNPDYFYEVGRRAGIPYSKEFTVRGTIQRAFVNGLEWKLAIGADPGKIFTGEKETVTFDPGKTYDNDNELEALVSENDYSSYNATAKNSYPIKTTGRFEINEIDNIPTVIDESGNQKAYRQYAVVRGLMINAAGIRLGNSGDIIRSTPLDWLGEKIHFGIEVT